MEYRLLGHSGLKVSALSFGAATFGGSTEFFRAWGQTGASEASRLVDICLEAGINLFDVADVYSDGLAEEVLGEAIKGKRNQLLVSTKATYRLGNGINDVGSSRWHILNAVDASLKRLKIDHIDIYHMHEVDSFTPIEETLDTLNGLVQAGKIRYIACSNYSGWHLMKSLAISERYGWARYVAQQSYYSLVGREFEWELMPLGLDQKVGTLVWSPLGWGRLTGKIRRGQPIPEGSRLPLTAQNGPPVPDEHLYKVVDVLDEIAKETGRSVPQIALNWVLHRPTVSSVIIGARNEEQLKQNLVTADFKLTDEQVARLDAASEVTPIYPYWHQRQFTERNTPPV
ncbi:aldo/keto reductase [Silvibacterium sp.]|uniref:aldo/keto reductase n=1 Tax=Silvibacterium sp. TaxID=1964179 RepID=UPI0039E3FB09